MNVQYNTGTMYKQYKAFGLLILGLFLCPNLFALPLSQYEKVNLNCHFYYENGNSLNLGKMKGISNCQSASYSWAKRNNIQNSDWDYVGCVIKDPVIVGGITIRKGSSCSEKIK